MTSGAQGGADKFVIYPSRIKALLKLLGSIAFLVFFVVAGVVGLVQGLPISRIVPVLGVAVPLFVALAFHAATRAVRPRPAVEMDAMGIKERATVRGQVFLGIVPRDMAGFLKRQPAVRRLLLRLNLAMGFPPVNIPQVGLPMKVAALAELLHERFGVRIESKR